jgi:hypothetical protein
LMGVAGVHAGKFVPLKSALFPVVIRVKK